MTREDLRHCHRNTKSLYDASPKRNWHEAATVSRHSWYCGGNAAGLRACTRRVRRVGVLMNVASDDPEAQSLLASFQQGLQAAGWTVGRDLLIDHRWATGEVERYRQATTELLALAPDVVLVAGAAVLAMQRASSAVPIVFAQAIDPVGAGFVASLAKPGATPRASCNSNSAWRANGSSCLERLPPP